RTRAHATDALRDLEVVVHDAIAILVDAVTGRVLRRGGRTPRRRLQVAIRRRHDDALPFGPLDEKRRGQLRLARVQLDTAGLALHGLFDEPAVEGGVPSERAGNVTR